MIHGEEGWISIADPFNCPPEIETEITIGSGGHDHPYATQIERATAIAANQYGLQATALTDAILAGESAPVPIEGSIANMRLIERLFAAAGMEMP